MIVKDNSDKLAYKNFKRINPELLQRYFKSNEKLVDHYRPTDQKVRVFRTMRVDKAITHILEKITLVKSTHYLILIMVSLFNLRPNVISVMGLLITKSSFKKLKSS